MPRGVPKSDVRKSSKSHSRRGEIRMVDVSVEKRTWQLNEVGEAYTNLAIAVIESAIKTEGLMYLQTESGQWWLKVLDMDVEGFLGYVGRISKQAS